MGKTDCQSKTRRLTAIFVVSQTTQLEMVFTTPVDSFFAFFTYDTQLTLQAFDSGNVLLATITSGFSSNDALLLGSTPNEKLEVPVAAGKSISRIIVTNADLF